nr:LytTR family DNA-binding domain-containing protein [uncultured Capnocytophaga sp.]
MPLKEITQKIDLFLAALPSDSLEACREQWAAFVWAYAQDYHTQQQNIERLLVRTAEGIVVLPIADILYLQSDKGYTTFFLEGGEKILVSKVLKKYEELLPPTQFVRCHQSYLVNMRYIRKYYKEGFLELTIGERIPVSERRREYVQQWLTRNK